MQRQQKEQLKGILPGFLIEGYHLLRNGVTDLGFAWARFSSAGKEVRCPICKGQFKTFRPGGEDIDVLNRYGVVGAGRRSNCVCPKCRSKERDRLLYLYLTEHSKRLSLPLRLLHMAPEYSLKPVLSENPMIDYLNGDLDPKLADLELDLTQLTFPDQSFEGLICNHVLEHIPDDRKAMREVLRVLKPGGWAILQVPVARQLTETLEDPNLADPVEREKQFGQFDHVRIYGMDYPRRLEECGFQVETIVPEELVGKEGIKQFGLLPDERLFLAIRPNS